MTGRKFDHISRWTFVAKLPGQKNLFRCACGTEKAVNPYHVRTGASASCGCLRKEVVADHRRTHGMSATREYRIWWHMKERCSNPNMRGSQYWLGSGVTVCDEWVNSFDTFLSDMGPCPKDKYSIDRIDKNGSYGPGNCRWATVLEQTNNLRNNIMIDDGDEELTLSQMARKHDLKYGTLYKRFVLQGDCAQHALRSKK